MTLNAKRELTPITPWTEETDPGASLSSSWGDVSGAMWRSFNTIGSTIEWAQKVDVLGPQDERLEDYDPFDGIDGTIFEKYPEALIDVRTPNQKARVEARLHQEMRDDETIASGGFKSIAMGLVMGVLDPVMLIPVAGQSYKAAQAFKLLQMGRKAKALRGGLLTARAGLVGESAAQLVFHGTQYTKTWGESALDISAATLFSGMLGSGIGALSRTTQKQTLNLISKDMRAMQAAPDDPKAQLVLGPEEFASNKAAEAKIEGWFGAQGFAHLMSRTPVFASPFFRTMVKSPSRWAKQTLLELGDSTAFVKGMDLEPSIESKLLDWDGRRGELMRAGPGLYTRYRSRVAKELGTKDFGEGGRLRASVVSLTARLQRGSGALTYNEFLDEVGIAATRGGESAIPEAGELAGLWRKVVFDPLLDEYIGLKLLPEEIKAQGPKGARSYLSRVYLRDKLLVNEQAFKRDTINPYLRQSITAKEQARIAKIAEETGEAVEEVTEREIALAADDIFENLIGFSEHRIATDGAPVGRSRTSALKGRVWAISDEELHKAGVLETNIETIGDRYIRSVVPDLEIRKKFGDLSLTERTQQIADEYTQLRKQAKSPRQIRLLDKQETEDLELLESLVGILRGTYGVPSTSRWVTAGRVARAVNYVSHGGAFTVNSIPDVGMVVLRNGLYRTFKTGLIPLATHWKGVKLSSRQARLLGAGLELELDTRSRYFHELGDIAPNNRLERGASTVARKFSLVNLLAPWNSMMKRWAGVVQQTRMIEALRAEAGGKIKKRDLQDLEFLRLGPGMRKRILAQLDGENGSFADGPIKWSNIEAWDDLDARLAWRTAMRAGVDNTILTPGLLDRPLLMHREEGRLILQYLSFAVTATSRITMTSLQRFDMATLNGLGIMVSLGMGVEALRRIGNKRELPEDIGDWIKSGIDRSGIMGIYSDIYNKGARLFGQDTMSSRYSYRNLGSTFLGPTFGTAHSTFDTIRGVQKGMVQSDVSRVRRMLPFNQVFYIKSLFDLAEEGYNDHFNVPKRRARRR